MASSPELKPSVVASRWMPWCRMATCEMSFGSTGEALPVRRRKRRSSRISTARTWRVKTVKAPGLLATRGTRARVKATSSERQRRAVLEAHALAQGEFPAVAIRRRLPVFGKPGLQAGIAVLLHQRVEQHGGDGVVRPDIVEMRVDRGDRRADRHGEGLRRGRQGQQRGEQAEAEAHAGSATTGLRRMPMPLISTSTTSPGTIQSGGLRACATPSGVPVAMTSPGGERGEGGDIGDQLPAPKGSCRRCWCAGGVRRSPRVSSVSAAGSGISSAVTSQGPSGPVLGKFFPAVTECFW